MSEKEIAESVIIIVTDLGELSFNSIDEFDEWFLNEKNAFSWLLPAAQKNSNLNELWHKYNSWYGPIQNAIQEYKKNISDNQQKVRYINEIKSHCHQAFVVEKIISSESTHGNFIINLSQNCSEGATAFSLAVLMNINIPFNNKDAVEGGFYALNYLKGDNNTVKAASDALENLKKSWAIKFGKFNKNSETEKDDIIREVDGLRSEIDYLKSEIKTLHESQEEEFVDLVKKSSANLSNIETTFEEKLALQSSVTYWTAKRKHNTTVMWVMGFITLFTAVFLGYEFIITAKNTLTETVTTTPLWKFGLFAVISTFGIWLVRLFSKIFISNLHLRTDADERITMMQTYLAMLKEGVGPKDDERKIILEVLFRHSQSGFINDDGPVGIADLLTKIINRKA